MTIHVLLVLASLAVLFGCGEPNAPAKTNPNANVVPDVVGMTVLAACRELRPSGYRGAVFGEVSDGKSGPSRVLAQEPEAGRKGYEGQLVRLTVSKPYPAGVLEQNPECLDRTQFGPGGRPNEPT